MEENKEEKKATSAKGEDEDHSLIYLKRDALYKELKVVNVSVENSSTIDVIKDFLRNKVNCREHIKQLKAQPGSISNQMQNIFDKARRHLDDHYSQNEPGTAPPNMQNLLQKMVFETFEDSGESLNEEDKLLLVKDLETLLGRAPPNLSALGGLVQPPAQSKFNCNNIVGEPKTEEIKTEEVKEQPSTTEKTQILASLEEEKEVKQPTPKKEDTKPSSRKGSAVKAKAHITSSSDDDEEIEFGSRQKPKWDFFGKIKKFFFKDKANKDE